MPISRPAQQLRSCLQSSLPGIFLLSSEDSRITHLLEGLREEGLVERLIEWHPLQGWLDTRDEQSLELPHSGLLEQDLNSLRQLKLGHCLFIIRRPRLTCENQAALITALHLLLDRLARDPASQSMLVMIDDEPWLPPSLGNRMHQLQLPLPDLPEIRRMLQRAEQQGLQLPAELQAPLLAALRGLTASEILRLLQLAIRRGIPIDEQVLERVTSRQAQHIGRSGLLQLVIPGSEPDRICGLENLRLWLEKRARIFQQLEQARSCGVTPPRALLIAGMPGCGKSTSVRLAARLFELPLLKLDSERLSPADASQQLQIIRPLLTALAPCILWIDALERTSNSPEVTRALQQLLSWPQQQVGSLFVVATANDLTPVADELLHRENFDEMFMIGLPNCRERRLIMENWLREGGHSLHGLNLNELAELCQDFSSADLLAALNEAVTHAFLENSPLSQLQLDSAIRNTIPQREILHELFSRCERSSARLKLRQASLQTGPTLSELYLMAEDPNHMQRLQVARNPDVSQDLLDRLARDAHPQVRRAVLNNPRCPQTLLSQRINIHFGATDYDGMLLAQACCHRNTPVELVLSLFSSEQFHPDREAMQMIAANTQHEPLQWLILNWAPTYRLSTHDCARLRFLLAGNPCIGEAVQLKLAQDSNWSVRRRLAQHPSLYESCVRQLATSKDMLVDYGLSRNPALRTQASLQLLESLDLYEFILISQIQPCEPAALQRCTYGTACICLQLQHLAPDEPLLLRPHPYSLQQLFSEPYLIVPLSPERLFNCPEPGCNLRFTYTRTLADPAEFDGNDTRLGYCPHVFRD